MEKNYNVLQEIDNNSNYFHDRLHGYKTTQSEFSNKHGSTLNLNPGIPGLSFDISQTLTAIELLSLRHQNSGFQIGNTMGLLINP